MKEPFDECSICLTSQKKSLKVLECSHTFHTDCINMWTASTPKCPLCRAPVVFKPIEDYTKTTVNELKRICRSNGLCVSGPKSKLCARIECWMKLEEELRVNFPETNVLAFKDLTKPVLKFICIYAGINNSGDKSKLLENILSDGLAFYYLEVIFKH